MIIWAICMIIFAWKRARLVIRNKKYAKHLAHELQKRNILHFLI
jgi:hypothetical protein